MAHVENGGHTIVFIGPTVNGDTSMVGDSYGELEARKSSEESSMHSHVRTALYADISEASLDHKHDTDAHVVTIKINSSKTPIISSVQLKQDFNNFYNKNHNSSVRLNVETNYEKHEPFINYNTYPGQLNMVMSSGQCSPSDTLDSGTCSDLDGTPPPLPKKKTSRSNGQKKAAVTQMRTSEDVDFYEDNDSYDSLNSSELSAQMDESVCDKLRNNSIIESVPKVKHERGEIDNFLQKCLLDDIREITPNKIYNKVKHEKSDNSLIITEASYEDRHIKNRKNENCIYETDKYYNFHLNEKDFDKCEISEECENGDEFVECFAGYKDLKGTQRPATIKSSKGTIRGVKNRVRAGIATFLQMQNSGTKNYKEKDSNKVVLYTTTMGIVRSTYQRCMLVKKILRNHLVKYEERDVFMSLEYQDEIKERMQSSDVIVPQLYIDGQYIGDAEVVEKLNENGELRKMLKPYKSPDACNTCAVCGGFRLLPCKICNGSKKSLHRNNFTAEFVALKCMNCDEVGLVRCEACS